MTRDTQTRRCASRLSASGCGQVRLLLQVLLACDGTYSPESLAAVVTSWEHARRLACNATYVTSGQRLLITSTSAHTSRLSSSIPQPNVVMADLTTGMRLTMGGYDPALLSCSGERRANTTQRPYLLHPLRLSSKYLFASLWPPKCCFRQRNFVRLDVELLPLACGAANFTI